jgi:hypothetical protein
VVENRSYPVNFAVGGSRLQVYAAVFTTLTVCESFSRSRVWALKSQAKAAASGARRSDVCDPKSGIASNQPPGGRPYKSERTFAKQAEARMAKLA